MGNVCPPAYRLTLDETFETGNVALLKLSVVVTATTDRTTGRTKHFERESHDEQDNPDGPEDRNGCDEADDEQNDAKNDHV
jgi:hypothetical protein